MVHAAIGSTVPIHGLWLVFFPATAMVLAMLALTVIYWVARPKEKSLRHVLPGAMLATLLWWFVTCFLAFMCGACRTAWSMADSRR